MQETRSIHRWDYFDPRAAAAENGPGYELDTLMTTSAPAVKDPWPNGILRRRTTFFGSCLQLICSGPAAVCAKEKTGGRTLEDCIGLPLLRSSQPIVVYHGTQANIAACDLSRSGEFGPGIFPIMP